MSSKRWSSSYLLAGMVASTLMVLSGFLVWKQRQEGYAMAEVSVANTAGVLAAQVENSLDQANALLLSVSQRYKDAGARGAAQVGALFDQVKREAPNYPLVSRVAITDDRGLSFFNTSFPTLSAQHLDLSDRDYFIRARAGEKGLIFSNPLQARLTGEWSLVMARRIESDRGEFMGVAFVVLPVQGIGRTFASVALGSAGIIDLRTAGLEQVVRYPDLSGANRDIGNRNVSPAIQDLMRGQPGAKGYVYETVAPINGIERVYAYRKFDHSPFWMTVGRAISDSRPRGAGRRPCWRRSRWRWSRSWSGGRAAWRTSRMIWKGASRKRKPRTSACGKATSASACSCATPRWPSPCSTGTCATWWRAVAGPGSAALRNRGSSARILMRFSRK